EGFDLAHPDYPIGGRILVHHINPLTAKEVEHGGEGLLDPNNLICVSHDTHNAIHFGDSRLLRKDYVERKPGDTLLWKRGVLHGSIFTNLECQIHNHISLCVQNQTSHRSY